MAPAAGFANEAQARRLDAQALLTDGTDLSDVNSPSAEIIGNTRVDLRKRGLLAAISVTKSTGIFVHEISTVFYDLSATITVFKSWNPLESVSTI